MTLLTTAKDVSDLEGIPPRSLTGFADVEARALRGGIAKLAAQIATFCLRISAIVVLARLLEPRDFGLVNMVTVATGLFGLFKDAGLSLITVQRPKVTDAQISTLFWLNVLVGAILTVATAAIAPVLVAFYDEPRLFWITVITGAGFLFNAFGVQHMAILQRRMSFAALAMVEVAALAVSVGVGIGLALSGYGYWALVGMTLSAPVVSSAAAWVLAGWIPSSPRQGDDLRSMMRFGSIVSLNGLVIFFAYNLDKLLLGRFAGAESLGIYGRAYQLVNIPSDMFQQALGGVAISALSRLQDNASRFRAYFLKGYSVFLAITLPITLACAVFAADIVHVLLGPKWSESALLFKILTPTILAFSLVNPVGWLLFATGQVERSLRMAFVIAPVVITACALGIKYGALGVAVGFSGAMVILTAPMIAWGIRGSVVSGGDIVSAIKAPCIAALAAAAVTVPMILTVGEPLAPGLRLVLGGGLFLTSYLLLLLYPLGQKNLFLGVFHESIGRS